METDLGLGLPELKLYSWGVSCQSRGVSTLSLEVSEQTDNHCGMGCFETLVKEHLTWALTPGGR